MVRRILNIWKPHLSVIHEFSLKIASVENAAKKEELIRNFYIPNTKEDIIEFFILATSNIGTDICCYDAWTAKLEQTYQKARLILGNTKDFNYIDELYTKAKKSASKNHLFQKIFTSIIRYEKLRGFLLGIIGFLILLIGIAKITTYSGLGISFLGLFLLLIGLFMAVLSA